MGEDGDGDGDGKSRRQRLLSRFTRARNDQDAQDRTVDDFLKPSTEKAAALPMINVAVAQRFPAAQSIHTQDESHARQEEVNGLRKKRRREGLKVAFVEQPPEIIGEGGDEAPYPPIEYARLGMGEDRLRRTSYSKHPIYPAEQSSRPIEHARAGASRLNEQAQPQGRMRHDVLADQEFTGDHESRVPRNAAQASNAAGSEDLRRGSSSPVVVDKVRAMRANEGMALRRGSAFMDDHDDDEDNDMNDDHDPPPHFQHPDRTLAPAFRAPPFPHHHRDAKPAQHARSQSSDFQRKAIPPVPRHNDLRPGSSSESSPTLPRYPGQAQYQAYRPPASQYQPRDEPQRLQQSMPTAADAIGGAATGSQQRSSRPSSMSSTGSSGRASDENRQGPGENALNDFATRVAHMKGVFALTAERERPAESCSPEAWLRTACWWYVEGKIELEHTLRRRARSTESARESLLQGHVDLAKSWWILTVLKSQHLDRSLAGECSILQGHLQALCLSIGKSRIMPPPASLIQGQDTRIWLEYPKLDRRTVQATTSVLHLLPSQVLPMADTADMFCYNRFRVHVAFGSSGAPSQQSAPCILSVVRDTRTYENSIIIASQSDAVTLLVGTGSDTIPWHDIQWHMNGNYLSYRADESSEITIHVQEQDLRLLRSMMEYTRKAVDMLRCEPKEYFTFRQQVLGARYIDSSKSRIFPRERIRDCQICVFERSGDVGLSRRLTIVTFPATKILSCVSHQLYHDVPVLYETFARQDGASVPAMRVFLHDDGREAELQLDFANMQNMQQFCASISGCQSALRVEEIANTRLSSFAIDMMVDTRGSMLSKHLFSELSWRDVAVLTSSIAASQDTDSQSLGDLRLAAQHSGGYMLSTLHAARDVPFRLYDDHGLAIELMCHPQADFTASLDQRILSQDFIEPLSRFIQEVQSQPTFRRFTFADEQALHSFQRSAFDCEVLSDSTASSFIVSRRRMGVSVKHSTSGVRIQLVHDAHNASFKVIAFMHDFELANAMCFEIKPTDTFEQIRGDSKGKAWAVKLSDVNFQLPPKVDSADPAGKIRRRFTSLAEASNASEHGDIIVGFDNEADRDVFSAALPISSKPARSQILRKRV